MTDVNSTVAPALPATQEMTAAPPEPPTMKNAGRLSPESLGMMGLTSFFVVLAVFAIVVGGMLLAVMVSHGRRSTGIALHAIAGLAGLAIILLAQVASDGGAWITGLIIVAMTVGFLWLLLGVIAIFVGSTIQPPRQRRRPPATP